MSRAHISHDITVVPYTEFSARERADSILNSIFYEASSVQSFATEEFRTAFRDRWLGRFLRLYGDHAFLAVDSAGQVVGYVVGATDDPAQNDLFEDIGYFAMLSDLTCRYPAHLHINVAAGTRSAGIGGHLIGRFCAHAEELGLPGVHVVTAFGARNTGFYKRMSFDEVRRFDWQGKDLVMLARRLSVSGSIP